MKKGYALGFEEVVAYIDDQLPQNEHIRRSFSPRSTHVSESRHSRIGGERSDSPRFQCHRGGSYSGNFCEPD